MPPLESLPNLWGKAALPASPPISLEINTHQRWVTATVAWAYSWGTDWTVPFCTAQQQARGHSFN